MLWSQTVHSPACLRPSLAFSTTEGTIFIPSFNSVTVSKLSPGSIAKPELGVGIHFLLCRHSLLIIASVPVESKKIKGPDVVSVIPITPVIPSLR